jgi:hypothetical protein
MSICLKLQGTDMTTEVQRCDELLPLHQRFLQWLIKSSVIAHALLVWEPTMKPFPLVMI